MGNPNIKPFSQLIEKSEKICEWVELGILSYKICDRNFDCENCPLDKALRGFLDESSVVNRNSFNYFSSLDHLVKIKQSENYFVCPKHTWVEVIHPKEVKIGVDDVTAVVLGSIDRIKLPKINETIFKDACCGEVFRGEHKFSISSPVGGRVKSVNVELEKKPNQLTLDPLNKGWMIKVQPDNLQRDLACCRNGDALFTWYLKEMKWVEHKLTESYKEMVPSYEKLSRDESVFSREFINDLPGDYYENLVMSIVGKIESKK